ncbi:suppressor of fused domain protein [Paenibacillus glycinis]|uniref:Suppressor of fused domain protein n=1 Tax=Paenibacillus glycinis TaxID=2697035 RepID=A0ABW9XTW9_9BACL|nr:suppressor of fused domain protein [Paenibacillus glycinis]NBD26117.1 suppressor of fused domain protein [Paenibacillus glycinis]
MVKPTEYTASGQPVYKYELREREWEAPDFGEEGWMEKIQSHVESHYGEVEAVFHEIISDLVHVDVHWIKPSPGRNYHTLFTTGMSYKPMNAPEPLPDYRYAELMVFLPASWPISQEAFQNMDHYWPVFWLKKLARFPHEYGSWLAISHTMPNGNPAKRLSARTKQNGFVLLPPLDAASEFQTLRMDEERLIRFYAIVPLYEEEMQVKLDRGFDALIEKLEQGGVSQLIHETRANVGKKPSWKFW